MRLRTDKPTGGNNLCGKKTGLLAHTISQTRRKQLIVTQLRSAHTSFSKLSRLLSLATNEKINKYDYMVKIGNEIVVGYDNIRLK